MINIAWKYSEERLRIYSATTTIANKLQYLLGKMLSLSHARANPVIIVLCVDIKLMAPQRTPTNSTSALSLWLNIFNFKIINFGCIWAARAVFTLFCPVLHGENGTHNLIMMFFMHQPMDILSINILHGRWDWFCLRLQICIYAVPFCVNCDNGALLVICAHKDNMDTRNYVMRLISVEYG